MRVGFPVPPAGATDNLLLKRCLDLLNLSAFTLSTVTASSTIAQPITIANSGSATTQTLPLVADWPGYVLIKNMGAGIVTVDGANSETIDGAATVALNQYEAVFLVNDGTNWHNLTGTTPSSGTYTPTLTNVANLDASTAYQCQYLRVGSTVTVSGKVDADPTAPAASTQLGISLPIASNFGAVEDCAGTAFASGIAGQGAAIIGDAGNNRAQMQWVAGDVTNQAMFFSFSYQVI